MKHALQTFCSAQILTAASLMLVFSGPAPATAAAGPQVVMRSLIMNVDNKDHYWADPNKDAVTSKPAWLPHSDFLYFLLEGPYSGGKLSMEFLKPDGKTWLTTECTPEASSLTDGQVTDVSCNNFLDKQAIPTTGLFTFKIHLDQGGTRTDLVKGRFKIVPYQDKESKQMQFGIDEDWRVPIGAVSLNDMTEPSQPTFDAFFWFKQRDLDFEQLKATLYLDGKPVGVNTDEYQNANLVKSRKNLSQPADHKQDLSYELWKFHFEDVRGSLTNDSDNPEGKWYVLAQHPGHYELKVTYGGKLVRNARFNVGADGKISAPGLAEKDGYGNRRILVPTQISGDLDFPWDKAAYQTEFYYGNPGPQSSGILAP